MLKQKNNPIQPKILIIGTYKKTYTRNVSLIDALTHLGYPLNIVNFEILDSRLELPEDFTVKKTLIRVLTKIRSGLSLLTHASDVFAADVIFVLHPGHLDLPLIKLLTIIKKVFRKKTTLFFDNSISPYDIMFIGRSIADRNSIKAKLVKHFEQFTLGLADKIIVDTPLMGDFLKNEFAVSSKKILVIPLGANEEIYTPSEILTKKTTSVLFFGLFNPMHGLPFIMDAIKLLRSEKEIQFTILGDGYMKPELIKFVDEHQLKNIHFEGFMPEIELAKMIHDCDIMLGIFTDAGTFQKVIPNKVYAGLACQKTVITADLPASRSFFTDRENIVLCTPNSSESIADAILELHKNVKLRMKIAKSGYQHYLNNFSSKHIRVMIKNAILDIQ